jgi:hypothetical protein
MAAQNGLLDLMKSPAAMGLLAAGFGGLAGANRNTPINNLGRAGLAGIAGYSAADSLQQKQKKLDQAEAIKAAIPSLYGADGKFDHKGYLGIGGTASDAKSLAELSGLGTPEAWKTVEVPGLDGSKKIITLDKSGRPLGEGFAGYVAPHLVDTGDKKQFVVPQAGQSFGMGMTPGQTDASNRGWANVELRGDSNDIARENNVILGDLKAQEKQLQVDKLKSEQAGSARALQAQQAATSAQISVIDKALSHPGRETVTGLSGSLDPRNYVAGTDATNFKTVVDQIGGTAFLQAFESLKGGGQITEIEGKKATDAMARLNTAQSDSEFKASLQELREVMVRAQSRLGGSSQGAQQPQASQGQPAQRAVVRTGMMNGRKVIQYADGSTDYAD